MRAPRDRTAARRARPGPLLGATAAIAAVVGLVLGAAGGTHALWNDQITADLGIIQVGPGTPTPPAPFPGMTCSGEPYSTRFRFEVPAGATAGTKFSMWLNDHLLPDRDPNSDYPIVDVGGHLAADVLHIHLEPGQYAKAEVLVTAYRDRETVVGTGTVWFVHRNGQVLALCTAPLTAPQTAGEGS